MNFKVKLTDTVDEDQWNDNLKRSTASTIYQVPSWCNVYRDVFDSEPVYVTVTNTSNEIVAQLACLVHTKYFWSGTNKLTKFFGMTANLGKHLFWNYGPIIHDEKNFDEIFRLILESVDDFAKNHDINFIRGSSPPLQPQPDNCLLESFEYEKSFWSTFVIDLKTDKDEYFESLNKSIRYDIRKAKKSNIELELGKDSSSFLDYAKMKYDSKGRAGHRRGYDPSFYETEWNYLYNKDFMKIFLAKKENEYISGILCFVFNGNVIQHGAVNSSKAKLQGGSFVTWNGIQWCIENNLNTFDFAGVNPNPSSEKEKGIDFFKSKWNGKKFEYKIYLKKIDKTQTKLSFALQEPKKILHKLSPKFF